jgi:hypothetical protein
MRPTRPAGQRLRRPCRGGDAASGAGGGRHSLRSLPLPPLPPSPGPRPCSPGGVPPSAPPRRSRARLIRNPSATTLTRRKQLQCPWERIVAGCSPTPPAGRHDLRFGQGARPQAGQAREPPPHGPGCREPQRRGQLERHARLHGAGGGARRHRHRSPGGPVRAGLCRLGAPHRHDGLRRGKPRAGDDSARPGGAEAAVEWVDLSISAALEALVRLTANAQVNINGLISSDTSAMESTGSPARRACSRIASGLGASYSQ